MPERNSIETFANPGNPEGSFEFETRADFHVGNPDLRSLNEVRAADEARAFAESSRPDIEQAPTPHGAARILTLYVIHMRRSKQGEAPVVVPKPKPVTQNDFELYG